MSKSLGQVAFEAYNESKGGLTYDGKPIPPWDSLTGDVGESVKRAWESAVLAALSEVRLKAGEALSSLDGTMEDTSSKDAWEWAANVAEPLLRELAGEPEAR